MATWNGTATCLNAVPLYYIKYNILLSAVPFSKINQNAISLAQTADVRTKISMFNIYEAVL